MTYRRRSSPLHAARASVGAAFCLVLTAVTLVLEHPLVLLALLGGLLAAAGGARVGREVARAVLVWGLPFALAIAAINALVVRDGATVLVRGWVVPVLGQLDVTLEESQLVVRGRQVDDRDRHFLHRGIAARQFQRTFVLADGMEVLGANLSNGLLSIDLVRPEAARIVRRIDISCRD